MLSELKDFLHKRTKINLALVIINILIFLTMTFTGGNTLDAVYMSEHGAMLPSAVMQQGECYRLFTSMFLHFGAEHLIYNMMLLIFAGDMLERRIGAVRYLLVSLGGGLAGNMLSLAVNLYLERDVVSAGASGLVFAVIGALVWLIVKTRGNVSGINSRGVCVMAALSLVQGFMDSGVDNYAHLGGFIGGFVLAAVSGILSVLRGDARR